METIKRILQDKITNRIAPGKAVLIFGARRVGKTVMMRKIVDTYPGRTQKNRFYWKTFIEKTYRGQLSTFVNRHRSISY